jgi:hypothetical protein
MAAPVLRTIPKVRVSPNGCARPADSPMLEIECHILARFTTDSKVKKVESFRIHSITEFNELIQRHITYQFIIYALNLTYILRLEPYQISGVQPQSPIQLHIRLSANECRYLQVPTLGEQSLKK